MVQSEVTPGENVVWNSVLAAELSCGNEPLPASDTTVEEETGSEDMEVDLGAVVFSPEETEVNLGTAVSSLGTCRSLTSLLSIVSELLQTYKV